MERKFGHCVANWTIQNSHILPMNYPFQILSPEFDLRSSNPTKWVMKLKNEEIGGEFRLHFQLQKLDSYTENLRFSGECNVEIYSEVKDGTSFRDFFSWEINSNKMVLNRRIQPNHKFDILLLYNLHIECKLLITFCGIEEDIETDYDVELRELSRNLLRIYESERRSDVVLKVNGTYSVYRIKAHRVILQPKSTIFRNILHCNKNEVTVDHYGRIDEWRNIVKFLYTADMKHVLDPPRISYYDISVAYNIEPIIFFYQPDEIILHSAVPLEEYSVNCTLPNFLTRNEICIEIPRLTNSLQDTYYKISVFPRSFADESNTCIRVTIRVQIPKSVLVELYATTEHSKELLNRISGKIANNTTCEKRSFHEREILSHYLQDCNLTLILKLQMVNLDQLNECKRYSYTIIKCKPYSEENKFLTLSRDMKKINMSQ